MAKRMTNTEFLNYSYNIQKTFFCEMTVFQYLAKIAYIDLTKKFSFFFIATQYTQKNRLQLTAYFTVWNVV